MKLPFLDTSFVRLRADLKSIADIREHLINTALLTFVVLLLPALAVSLARTRTIGWQPVFVVHIVLTVSMFLTFVFRRRISYNVRAGQMLLLLYVSAIGGFLNLGLGSAGIALLLSFSILTAIFFGKIAGRVATLLSVVSLVVVAAAAQAGWLFVSFDFNEFMASSSAWLNSVTALITLLGVTVSSVILLIGYLQKLVGELGERSSALEHAVMLLEEQLDRQQEIERHQARLLETMSHEFRTPLQIIQGSSYLLSRKLTANLEGEQKTWAAEHFSRVEGAVNRTEKLLRQMLTVRKLQHQNPERKEVEVGLLLDQCVAEVASLSSDVTIVRHIADDSSVVFGDARLLQSVLTNLLSNAVKFTLGAGQVEVRVQRAGDTSLLIVKDRGIGIPAAELESLGKPFFRASNAVRNAIPGLGLGLSVVELALKTCGGSMRISSVEGAGTTVTVSLVARPEPAPEIHA